MVRFFSEFLELLEPFGLLQIGALSRMEQARSDLEYELQILGDKVEERDNRMNELTKQVELVSVSRYNIVYCHGFVLKILGSIFPGDYSVFFPEFFIFIFLDIFLEL